MEFAFIISHVSICVFVVLQADKICLKLACFLNCHEIIISSFFQLFILFFSSSVLHACFARFTSNLTLFFLFLTPHAGNLAHFPCLGEVGMVKEKVHEYDAVLSNLIQEFDSRFEDFRHNTADFELFAQPFTISVDAVRDDLQMELIDLQCDSELKHKFTSLPLTDFYKCVPANRYPKMCKQAQVMLSLFGSTYLCEQTFSLMNLNKSKLRSKLTDSHLQNILSLSVSQLQPNLEKLLKNKDQFHISH